MRKKKVYHYTRGREFSSRGHIGGRLEDKTAQTAYTYLFTTLGLTAAAIAQMLWQTENTSKERVYNRI